MPDEYLLFADLPFDFGSDLPQDVGNGVWLDNPRVAYNVIDADERLAALATPERQAGLGEVHVCFRRRHTCRIDSALARDDLWLAVLALRLAKPVHIRTVASLAIDVGQLFGRGFSQNAMETRIDYASASNFDVTVVHQARDINLRLNRLHGRGLERIRSALVLFSHITTGRVSSWQLNVLGLFGCLECVFPQPAPAQRKHLRIAGENYAERLGRRVGAFLNTNFRRHQIEGWLVRAYDKRRNPLAHGFHGARFGGRGNVARTRLLKKLHEISRLTLLGFLAFDNDVLRALLPVDADRAAIQDAIDLVGAAPETYLRDQNLWN